MATITDTLPDTTRLDGLINAALDIANRDALLCKKIKDAVLSDDPATALQAACDLIDARPGSSISAIIYGQKQGLTSQEPAIPWSDNEFGVTND